jgi:hypothetical protein
MGDIKNDADKNVYIPFRMSYRDNVSNYLLPSNDKGHTRDTQINGNSL